jgi:hypothetical protein
MQDSTPILLNNREIGEISSDGYFQTRIYSSRHFLTCPPAIAWADEVIEQAKSIDAPGFRVVDLETNKVYLTTLDNFERHSFKVHRGAFEPQHAMRLEMWDVSGGFHTGDANKAFKSYYKRQATQDQQLSLFR